MNTFSKGYGAWDGTDYCDGAPSVRANTSSSKYGPPPVMTPAQQQTQTQKKMQAPKQQNSDSRARGAAAGAANRDFTGNAGKDAAGRGTQNRQAPRPQGGAKR
jgi:hypothetical protein